MTRTNFTWAAISVCALVFAASASATTLTFDSQTFPIDNGGQFGAHLDSNAANSLTTYCVDFNNSLTFNTAYNVVISTPTSIANISGTHFGSTAQGSFTEQTGASPTNYTLGNNLDRYLEAAWLIQQYSFTAGANTGMTDRGIQNAIWDLLDVGSIHTDGNYQTWINNAAAWLHGESGAQLSAFGSTVRIYTSATATGGGVQEMIGFAPGESSPTPEPASAALGAIGILLIGLAKVRQRKAQKQS